MNEKKKKKDVWNNADNVDFQSRKKNNPPSKLSPKTFFHRW